LIHCTPLVVFFCSVTAIILSVKEESIQSIPDVRASETWKYNCSGIFVHVNIMNLWKQLGRYSDTHYLESWGRSPLSQHLWGQPVHYAETLFK
jgi:hypothetical protein